MALTALIIITLASISWSLWIRRVTWHCRWEVAATLNIALQGCAVALMSPLSSETLGVALHNITGEWNLQNYVGHDCYVVAASAIVYNAVGRLEEDDRLQASFKQYVERPATLCIPLLLATFYVELWQQDLCARFLCATHRLLAERVLGIAHWNPGLPAGVRLARAAGAAQGPTVEEHRQPLSGRLGQRHLCLCGADDHCGDSSVPRSGGCRAGLVLRLHVRRGFRADLCELLAAEAQMVPATSGAPSLPSAGPAV